MQQINTCGLYCGLWASQQAQQAASTVRLAVRPATGFPRLPSAPNLQSSPEVSQGWPAERPCPGAKTPACALKKEADVVEMKGQDRQVMRPLGPRRMGSGCCAQGQHWTGYERQERCVTHCCLGTNKGDLSRHTCLVWKPGCAVTEFKQRPKCTIACPAVRDVGWGGRPVMPRHRGFTRACS